MRSAKAEAWAATQAAFAKRVKGDGQFIRSTFDTDFDAAGLADRVELPTGVEIIEHQAAFARLKKQFEQEWQEP